jgi:hypothetical protein
MHNFYEGGMIEGFAIRKLCFYQHAMRLGLSSELQNKGLDKITVQECNKIF